MSIAEEEAELDFFEKALADAGQWTRFADSKAIAALVILGLALANLLSVADSLVHAHRAGTVWGWLATIAFWVALGFAASAVASVAGSLFPRVKPHAPSSQPVYFFAHVAAFASPEDYEHSVRGRSARELESAVASQAWEVARVAASKHRLAKAALACALAFLGCWAVARLGLSLSK
jgi:hypothetical protein